MAEDGLTFLRGDEEEDAANADILSPDAPAPETPIVAENGTETLTGLTFMDTPETAAMLARQKLEDTVTENTGLPLGVVQTLAAARTENILGQFATRLTVDWPELARVRLEAGVDPTYRPSENMEALVEGIPRHEREYILEAGSLEEGLARRAIIEREAQERSFLAATGTGGLAAQLLVGFLDIDTLMELPLIGAGFVAKGATLAARFKRGAGEGVAIGLTTEGANAAVNPTVTSGELLARVLTAVALQTAIAPLAKASTKQVDDILKNADAARKADEAAEATANPGGTPDSNIPGGPQTAPGDATAGPQFGDSVGAQRNPNRPQRPQDIGNDASDDIIRSAQDQLDDLEVNERVRAAAAAEKTATEQVADKADDLIGQSVFSTVFQDGFGAASSVARLWTFRMFEDASGQIRNNLTAANLQEVYQKTILGEVMEPLKEAGVEWAKARGISRLDQFLGRHNDAFGKEVTLELNFRRLNDTPSGRFDANVTKAADAIEAGGDTALRKIARDPRGGLHVDGFEEVTGRGYTPLVWKADNLRDMRAAGASQDDLIGLYKEGYRSALNDVDEETLTVLATAVIKRTTAKGAGLDESLINLLSADGRLTLLEDLKTNGLSADAAEAMVNRLAGRIEDRGKAGFAKRRTEIDLSAEFNGFKLADLVDTNLENIWARYSRQIAGRGALARQGLTNFSEIAKIKQAIKTEQEQLVLQARLDGRDADKIGNILSDRDIDDFFTYFEGGPIAGGVSPGVRRAKQLTNLAFLSGLGLTQAAELGPQIAAVGWRNFLQKTNLKQAFKESPDLVKEFEKLGGPIGMDEILFPDNLTFDFARQVEAGSQPEFLDILDAALGKAQRVQGVVSGFYKMRSIQQRWAVEGMVHKLDDVFKDLGGPNGIRRAEDIGLRGEVLETIRNHYATGVTRNDKGVIVKMNLDQLPEEVAFEFAAAMNRHTNQVVQKAMAGEQSAWMHRDMGSLLTQLIMFPILAMQKQTTRNMRNLNVEALLPLVYGLMSAGVVVTAKDAVNGRDTTPLRAMNRAFGFSNMTGFVPTLFDPLASMFGLDDLRFNRFGATSDLIAPPSISAINNMARLPGAVISLFDGETTSSERRALRTVPVVGSLYGTTRLLNATKP